MLYAVRDWDDAYANGPNIAGGERWPGLWVEAAERYRTAMLAEQRARLDIPYGEAPRQRLDLFTPQGEAHGLVVFVHGGYWMRFDKSTWSHLAQGAVARGYAVAMPSYTLCPEAGIADITIEIGRAIGCAMDAIEGPVALTGHSAGGHLVTRMVCTSSPLSAAQQKRIAKVVSISGVHDLRPLLKTAMNNTLRMDARVAHDESPALLSPCEGARVIAWVGGAERAEFRRQSQLLANIWTGLAAATAYVEVPDRHHFNVIDDLRDPESALVAELLS
jgi:arylformamidase